ncbi:MAG: hypothetical protein HIU86_13265 [Acidobacteria bacterium]|nr:hypothetical protein [Acidobacteriota bacterium]
MTSWQDQQTREGAGGAVDASSGAPMSRRAAREAERRAAEALAEKQPHPSGVVDFEAHDFSPEFAPDQGFDVGDTQDIWAALTRGQHPATQPTGELTAFRSGVPEAPAAPRTDNSSVSGELLDRVRDAVLRREGPAVPQAGARPATAPQPFSPQQPQAFLQPPVAFSQPVQVDDPQGLTRRQRREAEIADQREDGLPNDLFDPRRAAPQPQQPTGFEGYDYDDGYYDEPYQPEPTIAIPRQATDLDTPSGTTNPISLPHAFRDPAGDDAITFSSPVEVASVEHRDGWAAAQADPAFIEPEDRWEDEEQAFQPRPYEPRGYAAGPIPAQPASPFVQPQAQFQNPQLGPPSEVTDLAGFEALIRKARQQPQAPEPVQQGPALAWADEQDVQEGFTGLLSRSVQGSHGSANALILPNDPQPDLTQAVSANGDIFITGSMNLPRSLSTTGAPSDLYDSHEIDRLYEASQDEPAAGVAPVRASKAVSGASHDRGFTSAPRRRGNILPTVLAIVAGAMAVGVVTLLVGSWVLKLF